MLAALGEPRSIIIDLGGLESIGPYGMIGLLQLGHQLRREEYRPLLHLPNSIDIQQAMEQMDFFKQALQAVTIYPPYRKATPRPSPMPPSVPIAPVATPDQRAWFAATFSDRFRSLFTEAPIPNLAKGLELLCEGLEAPALAGARIETREGKPFLTAALMGRGNVSAAVENRFDFGGKLSVRTPADGFPIIRRSWTLLPA